MGAWGTGSFENDDAMDWVSDLASAQDTTPLREAFTQVIQCDGYLELPEASAAIAAAEVVSTLQGRPADNLPGSVREYANRIDEPLTLELIELAHRAIERVKSNSELQELWDESDSAPKWRASVADLASRLK